MSLVIFFVILGVGKGVKILSEINLSLVFLLLIFVLVVGLIFYLLLVFSDNLGIYFSYLV